MNTLSSGAAPFVSGFNEIKIKREYDDPRKNLMINAHKCTLPLLWGRDGADKNDNLMEIKIKITCWVNNLSEEKVKDFNSNPDVFEIYLNLINFIYSE